MALINQNSIIGLTSITSPSASNVLTVHTNDTTERLRVSTSGLSFSGTNASLDTSGNATFNGNVSIGGTLTYEDVTNIDSVGIITAQSDVSISDKIIHTGDTNTSIRFPAADTFTVETAGTERLRISSTGSVGIGTNVPQATLHLLGSGGAATGNEGIRLQTTQATGGNWISFNDTARKGYFGYKETSDDGIYLVNEENSNIVLGTNGLERLRIDSTGDVRFAGTNLTNNTNKNVNLTAPSYNTSEEDVNLVQVENESGMNQISFGGGTSALNTATSLRFLTASAVNTTSGTERLRIDSVGSAQFTGSQSPSGRNTRISQYGSLLVATTGELISNARCAIDSGNGNITTTGEINVGGYNGSSTTTDGVILGAVGGVYSQLAASAAGTGVLWQGMHGSTFTSRIQASGAATFSGSIVASGVNLQNASTASWFQTGTSIGSYPYVWAAKNSSSNVWHSGLQTDGDLYLGGNLAASNNIALNGSNGSGWFTGGLGIGGNGTSNTMDEYEEGTYTPKIYAGTGTTEPAYNWQYGQYVRIGELVHVWGAFGINGSMPSCSQAYIGNLPYNQAYDSNNFFHYTELHGYTWASGYGDSGSETGLFIQTANGYGNKLLIVNGSAKNHVSNTMVGSNQRFTFEFSYVVG